MDEIETGLRRYVEAAELLVRTRPQNGFGFYAGCASG
jgi:hypothetical protein